MNTELNTELTSELRCAYLPLDQYRDSSAPWKDTMLGAVCFSRAASVADTGAVPFARVPMPALDITGADAAACEIWAGDGQVSYGARGALHYGHNDDFLFGAIQLPESQFDGGDAATAAHDTPLLRAARHAYREIFALLDATGFPHILRFWNYIADINGHSHDIERYRQFNIGRQEGFLASGRQVTGSVPAASAVGFAAGPLTIYFLAGRGAPPRAIENPRQVSAYDYPQQYGPRSPTFSRASVAHVGGRDVLFLSGTASIVGHRSLHIGDVAAQTRETMANIAAMVGEANRVAPQAGFTLADLCYKVYVRNQTDIAAIHRELRECLGPAARDAVRVMYLQADICRQDLLMEIEATAGHPLAFSFVG